MFPDEFILEGSDSDSGIGAIEIAVSNLNIAAKAGAMRQANAIRTAGQIAIKNQNRGMPTLNSFLPIRSVGRFTVPPSEPSGTLGYFISGWGDTTQGSIFNQRTRTDRFTFASDTITSLGARISPHLHYATANSTFGYIFGGASASNASWRMTYQTESFAQIGAALFPNRYYGASLKNQSRGYFCGGSSGGTSYGDVDRFTFAGEVCVSIGSLLESRNAPSGFGNRFNGYLAGGFANAVTANTTNTIERFSYASESRAATAASLSINRAAMSTWIPGSLLASYLMAGYCYGSFPNPGVSPARSFYTNVVDKFTFTGETCAALGSTLSKGIASFGAIGSPTRCTFGGGSAHTDAYTAQNTYNVESNELGNITFSTETNTLLASVLSQGRTYLSAVDNATF